MTDVLPPHIDPRSVTVEARWLPLPGHEHRLEVLDRALRHRQDVSWQVRAGVKEWLRTKARGEGDPTESKTRARYRRILAELADVDPDDGTDGLGAGAGPKRRPGGPPLTVAAAETPRAVELLRSAGFCVEVGGTPEAPIMYRPPAA